MRPPVTEAPWHITVREDKRRRRASARVMPARADGRVGCLITLPGFISRKQQRDIARELLRRLKKQWQRNQNRKRHCEAQAQAMATTTLRSFTEVEAFLDSVNRDTFREANVRLRIGNARQSRTAQMNIRLRTLTISCFCLQNVPARALRYLFIHELAHLQEANHGPRFWRLVAQFEPDYRQMDRLIAHHHREAVRRFEQQHATASAQTTALSLLTKAYRRNGRVAEPKAVACASTPTISQQLPLFEKPSVWLHQMPKLGALGGQVLFIVGCFGPQ